MWKSAIYGWARAYYADIRILGLNAKSFFNKSKAYYEAPVKKVAKFFFFIVLMLAIMFAANGESIDYISSAVGFPVTSKIF